MPEIDTSSLISELQGLEYLDINYIQGVPLSIELIKNSDNVYDDTRFLISGLEELYENEYFNFREEFNAYMEYNEVYDD